MLRLDALKATVSWVAKAFSRPLSSPVTRVYDGLVQIHKQESGDEVLYPCGHNGPRSYTLRAFGQEREGSIKRCPRCQIDRIRKTTTRCGRCGEAIFENSPVTTNPLTDSDLTFLRVAVMVGNVVVCCSKPGCSESGRMASGCWNGESYEPYDHTEVAWAQFERLTSSAIP